MRKTILSIAAASALFVTPAFAQAAKPDVLVGIIRSHQEQVCATGLDGYQCRKDHESVILDIVAVDLKAAALDTAAVVDPESVNGLARELKMLLGVFSDNFDALYIKYPKKQQ